MNTLRKFLAIISILLLLAGGIYISYKLWRLQHPSAPIWTFFLSGGR